ncbi:MAG: T9SS type A sorting domain-containing protein [Candidatus Zixiibacteriota bacterium]|nr:MAG: T9SS type A sorting domain-containing protein [candidate division Zixibacteria bacterium]
MKASHVLLALSLLVSAAYGYNDGKNYQNATDLPNTQLVVHRAPNINLSVTNFGFLGSQEGEFEDFEGYFDPAPGAMFPAYSDLDYLFQGAIWIGAEIDTVDQYGNPIIDTLVSIGNDGWWGNIFELWPEEYPGGAIWRDQIIADEEIFAEYYDTLTSSLVVPDPNDMRPHIPLGLKITQHTKAWSTPDFNEFIILDYIIENIGTRYLHNTWIGIYYDGDVWHYSQGGQVGAQDDICGYVQHGNYGIGWIADNDGDPDQGLFNYRSPRNVLGLALLGSTAPGLETNFNWWISNVNSAYDWGPQLQANYQGPFPGGGNGTPGGDKAKYFVMSNGEHDYGQMWCNLTCWENNGWRPRSPQAADLADGYDTRFLISFGPFDLQTGQVETLTVAYIGGSDFHTDPLNFLMNLYNQTFDSSSIAQYHANLGFAHFLEMADSAISFFEHNYINIPPGPPSNLHVADWSEDFVRLEWNPVYPPNLLEYRIYRGIEPGVYDSLKITPDGFIDSVFYDSTVQNNQTYYYVITSVSTIGLEGSYSNEASVNTGQPQTPTGLVATPGNAEVELNWDSNPDPDIFGYIIYKTEDPDTFAVLDTSLVNSYLDVGLTNGLDYFYYITAVDTFQYVSFNSDTVSALPMGFDSGILLINNTRGEPFNSDYDSMMVFYENILHGYMYDTTGIQGLELTDLADYSTLLMAKESTVGREYSNSIFNNSIYGRYLDAGGNIIVAGSRQLAPTVGFSGLLEYDSTDFGYRYLNLAAAEYPVFNSMEFSGGTSNLPAFDDFTLDSARTDRIEIPSGVPWGIYPGVGAFTPNDTSEVIYTYISATPDTSNYHGRPIGIVHQTDTYNTAVLEFPLYYVEEPISYQILHRILIDFGEVPTGIDEDQIPLPKTTQLLQNYPNPFNNATTLKYNLSQAGNVSITIYNILGQKVAEPVNGYLQAGVQSVTWNADHLPSGIYFARMRTEDYSGSIKLLLLK